MDKEVESKIALEERIKLLEDENAKLKAKLNLFSEIKATVKSPDAFAPVFDKAQKTVKKYFQNIDLDPSKGTISINNDRYVLIRASALSNDFFKVIKEMYINEGENEAFNIGQNFLFDMGHLIGMEDAKKFHTSMDLHDPLEKLSAGPVHFAYSGWAFVELLPECSPTPDENFYLKYNHPYSFEADSWIRKGEKSDKPVCIMNAAYSSGWCEQSYGMELTAVEITCKAKGDDNCTFIMAPPNKINEYLSSEVKTQPKAHKVPVFFERKIIEQGIKKSLAEKEILIKEIHHRVKNNLQIISSLLNLQFKNIDDKVITEAITNSKNRINSMAMVHTKLYQSDNLSEIDFGEYIKELTSSISDSYSISNKVVCSVKDSNIVLSIDLSINLGIIINELLTNAYKHAFLDIDQGAVKIDLSKEEDGKYVLIVEDNGIGMAEDIDTINPQTLGLEIVVGLVQQINGTIEADSSSGLKYTIRFED